MSDDVSAEDEPPVPRIGLFADVEDAVVDAMLAVTRPDRIPTDTVVVQQGDRSDGLVVLLTGAVRVVRQAATGEHELAVLGAGSAVGEVSLLYDEPATATATTIRETRVRRCRREDLDAFLAIPVVGGRLRDMATQRRAAKQAVEVGPLLVDLDDGTRVSLRPLWPDDWRFMAADKEHVSHESLYRRFLSVPKLNEPLLRRLATIDYVHDFAWAVLDEDGRRSYGGARYARDRDEPTQAEMALLVDDDVQRRGIGRLLLLATAVAARTRGIEHLDGVLFRDNHPVRRLLDGVGAEILPDEEPGLVKAVVSPEQMIDAIDDPDLTARIEALVRAVG